MEWTITGLAIAVGALVLWVRALLRAIRVLRARVARLESDVHRYKTCLPVRVPTNIAQVIEARRVRPRSGIVETVTSDIEDDRREPD